MPHGRILLYGPGKFQKRRRWQKRELILYSNVLLISNTKFKSDFRVKYWVPLLDMWVAHNSRNGARARTSLVLGWDDRSFVVSFHSVDKMEQWYSELHRNIQKEILDVQNTLRKHVEDIIDANSRLEETTEPPAGCKHLQEHEVGQMPATEELPQEAQESPSLACEDQQGRGDPLGACVSLEPGLCAGGDSTRSLDSSVDRDKNKSLSVAVEQRSEDSTAFRHMESTRQCSMSIHRHRAPARPPVLTQTAPEPDTEFLIGCGDRATYKVPVTNTALALSRPHYPINSVIYWLTLAPR
ncbi:uncharacterized protein LOC132533007 [Erinaceus europaeus]|uniref:Uncharacterized protein LOC132533007 n=1 Tax=Erinaceus europaeus TaxID=9365 RepID=A0ABM3VVH5_ERIEU|nr:uncharacterized protein LOC132533007 [Erinaceus europaeus]